MKHTFILIVFSALLFTSCSTAYRAAQTPDDLYYSPVKERADYYEVRNNTRDRYQENINSQDDRFLRMKVQNRDRWSMIDDYGYWYDSRYDYSMYNPNFYYNQYAFNNWYPGFRYGGVFGPNYFGYGGFYSPAYPVVYYKNPKVYTGATGKSNLATYMNTKYNNQNYNFRKGDGDNNNFGNLMRKVFVPNNNNSNNSNAGYERPVRTFEPSSTPSSSAGGRSGGYNSTGSSSSSSSRPPRN